MHASAATTVLKRFEEEGLAVTEGVKATTARLLVENDGHIGRTLNQLKRQFQPEKLTAEAAVRPRIHSSTKEMLAASGFITGASTPKGVCSSADDAAAAAEAKDPRAVAALLAKLSSQNLLIDEQLAAQALGVHGNDLDAATAELCQSFPSSQASEEKRDRKTATDGRKESGKPNRDGDALQVARSWVGAAAADAATVDAGALQPPPPPKASAPPTPPPRPALPTPGRSGRLRRSVQKPTEMIVERRRRKSSADQDAPATPETRNGRPSSIARSDTSGSWTGSVSGTATETVTDSMV